MNSTTSPEKLNPNFSQAFKQMASFVAIAKTRATSEVLEELILQCFAILPEVPLGTAEKIRETIQVLFGISINIKDISMRLASLLKSGKLCDIGNENLTLSPETAKNVNIRIDASKSLEKDVRETWLQQVQSIDSELDGDALWVSLRAYLQQSFRSHGIQAVELLNPKIVLTNSDSVGLSVFLDKIISRKFEEKKRSSARQAIVIFFRSVASDRKRAEYIASLADAAFNYFSLAVAPEVSEKLRGELNELILFLDTNFLFGILNLHDNSQVDVSNELLEAIKKFKLPFRLRYHEATAREMANTLYFYNKELSLNSNWPQKISRAIVSSNSLAGIEYRYHARNAEQSVSVEDFLAPYQHWQILLKDKGIDIYNVPSTDARLRTRAELESDYRQHLENIHRDNFRDNYREKPYEAIQHDMAVLETVYELRSNAKTTLDAGALLVTCDHHLFRFDFENTKKQGRQCSTVLPSLLWQILRPYISDNEEFDKAFAETFVLPEFSFGRGAAQRAAARMASILAGYSDIPEETAAKMLANDFLIAKLKDKNIDAEFIKTVESAIVSENAQLLEERAALAAQLESEKREHASRNKEIEDKSQIISQHEATIDQTNQTLRQKDDTITRLKRENEQIATQITKGNEDAKRQTEDSSRRVHAAETRADRMTKIAAISAGLFSVVIFEIVTRVVFPWTWLHRHPHAYGLEGCFGLLIIFAVIGCMVKKWRRALWVSPICALILLILSLLGGFNSPAT